MLDGVPHLCVSQTGPTGGELVRAAGPLRLESGIGPGTINYLVSSSLVPTQSADTLVAGTTTRGELVRAAVPPCSQGALGPGTIDCLVSSPLVSTQQGIHWWQVWQLELGQPEVNYSGQLVQGIGNQSAVRSNGSVPSIINCTDIPSESQ